MSRPQSGQGFGAEKPEKDTNGWIALSSDGPTPETLSRRAMLPNGPCSLRHATMRCASAGPIRGSRVISLTSALSRSIRSPGSSGRESCAARRAVSRSALGRGGEADCSWTSPGGAAEEGERTKRTPAPANARHANSNAARRSSISQHEDPACYCRTKATATSPTICRLSALTLSIVSSVVCQYG